MENKYCPNIVLAIVIQFFFYLGNELTGCNYIKSMFPIDISEWMDEPEPEVSER